MGASIDYHDGDVWDRLSRQLAAYELRPAARCGNVHCRPEWHWRLDLTDYDLWLAAAGRGSFTLGGETYPVRAGSLFWLRPGDDGLVVHDPADPLTVVYVHFDFFDRHSAEPAVVDRSLLPSRHIPLSDASRVESALARIVRLSEVPTVLGLVEARAMLNLAVIEIYRQDAINRGAVDIRPDQRVARVVNRLHRNPAERLSLTEAAAMANLSPDHFSRLFKAHTGTAFRRYGLDVRLERARHLLEESTLTISEVADALGYEDVFLFSRQCKARYGVAPSVLRRGR